MTSNEIGSGNDEHSPATDIYFGESGVKRVSVSAERVQRVREALKKRLDRSGPGRSEVRTTDASGFGEMLKRAAVREEYSLDEIVADLPDEVTSVETPQLLDFSKRTGKKRRNKWQLRPAIRNKVLRQMVSEGDLAAYVPSGSETDASPIQQIFSRCLRAETLLLDKMTRDDLAILERVVEWLYGIDSLNTPPKNEIRRYRNRLAFLAPHRALTRHFAGRKSELKVLQEYVEWLPATSVYRSVNRGIRGWFNLHQKPPLMIYGLGGAGKTTLVSQFILKHIDDPAQSVPFVYLDFDRPDVSVREPLTMLITGMRQLALQIPSSRDRFEELSTACSERLVKITEEAETRSKSSAEYFSTSSESEQEEYVQQFSFAWQAVERPEDPILLVMDSFEEVQSQMPHLIPDLFRFLQLWVQHCPRLRVVVVGRSQILDSDFPTEQLHLDDFDHDAAMGFLEGFFKEKGIENRDLTTRIIKAYGTNPLVLKLAAEIVTNHPNPDKLLDEEGFWHRLRNRLDTERTQTILFQRNLAHINDKNVEKLAFPGLVVRRLTPGVIQHVLAGPCGLDLGDDPEQSSNDLMDALERETFLVEYNDHDQLQYRPDLRRMTVDVVASEEPKKTKRIHDLAVEYYEKKSDPLDRAEEIYHRLMRGDNIDDVEKLLADVPLESHEVVAQSLQSSMPEFPPSVQIFLGSFYGIAVDKSILKAADLEEWETHTAAEIDRVLESGSESRLQQATKLLKNRSKRSKYSPLFKREAKLYKRLGPPEKARDAAELACEIAEAQSDLDGTLEMLFLLSRVEDEVGRQSTARRHLRRAHNLARRNNRNYDAIRAKLDELTMYFREETPSEEKIKQLYARIERLIGKLTVDELQQIKGYAPIVMSQEPQIRSAMSKRLAELGVKELDEDSIDDHFTRIDPDTTIAKSVLRSSKLKGYASELVDSLETNSNFEELLKSGLNLYVRQFTAPGSLASNVFELLRFAENHGLVSNILSAFRRSK